LYLILRTILRYYFYLSKSEWSWENFMLCTSVLQWNILMGKDFDALSHYWHDIFVYFDNLKEAVIAYGSENNNTGCITCISILYYSFIVMLLEYNKFINKICLVYF
jgi:hypothetical protein